MATELPPHYFTFPSAFPMTARIQRCAYKPHKQRVRFVGPALELRVELYTDEKRPDIEAMVEAVFDGHGLFYNKNEVWIAEERLYEVLYEMEVIQDE